MLQPLPLYQESRLAPSEKDPSSSGVCAWLVLSIKVSLKAGFMPPCPTTYCCTVMRPGIIIIISCTEGAPITISHGVWSSHSLALSNGQLVITCSIAHLEELVGPHYGRCTPIFYLNTQLHIISCGEAVDVFQAVPKLPLQISKAIYIVSPVAIEVHRAIDSPLNHQPFPSFCLHVTATTQSRATEGIVHATWILKVVCASTSQMHQLLHLHQTEEGTV